MYPHQKLDWSAGRLEQRLAESPDDVQARLELARICLSRGLYHGAGEVQCAQALQHARKVLQEDPASVEALVIAGAALVGMDRPEAAQRHLDEAIRLDAERPDLHLALGAMYRGLGDRHLAIRHLENACRGAPQSWEAHLLLGRTLAERAKQVPTGNTRLVERSQYHLVQALKLDPSPDLLAPLMRDLGVSCLQTGRYAEAEKLFVRLRENPRFSAQARKHLGQVAFALGKYKNAIQHYRHYLEAHGDDVAALAQMGMSYLHLGELDRAREYCNKALLLAPDYLPARHALGCTLLEEGLAADALRVFKETLEDHPEDLSSYVELIRTRRRAGDVPWLQKALHAEVQAFDRLPLVGGDGAPRTLTRRRIAILLDELRAIGPSSVPTVLGAVEMTEDEGLRFSLWEAACQLAGGGIADEVAARLREPGRNYSVALARNALAAASFLPEPALTAGLAVTQEDVARAAVDRRGNATDLTAHRRNVDAERDVARAYQALLLLAIAARRSRSARGLLQSWGKDADAELQVAVLAGQVMGGEADAARTLVRRAQERGAGAIVERLLAQVTPPAQRVDPAPVSDGREAHCSACGRTGKDCTHLMAGTRAVLCDVCVGEVVKNRRSILAPDTAACSLCGRTHFESRGVYRHAGVDVCHDCLDLSMGLMEREEVDRFLATW
ncbi:MAG: tetratricopeptide repeat protein [Myxococcota bacterium]